MNGATPTILISGGFAGTTLGDTGVALFLTSLNGTKGLVTGQNFLQQGSCCSPVTIVQFTNLALMISLPPHSEENATASMNAP